MAPGRREGERTQGLRVTLGRSRRSEPHHFPPLPQGHHVTLCTLASTSFPKRSSKACRLPRSPSLGHQAEEQVFSRGFSPAHSPAQGSQVCCVGWLQLSATEDRCYRSSVSTHRGLFNVSFHGFPSNLLIHNFTRLGRFVSTLKAAENIFRKAVLVWGPKRILLANSGPWPWRIISALLVFLLQARPGAEHRALGVSVRAQSQLLAGRGSGVCCSGVRRGTSVPLTCPVLAESGREHVWTARRT